MARDRLGAVGLILAAAILLAAPARAEWGYLYTIGSAGTAPGQYFNPYGLAGDAAGNLYLADSGNFRVQKLKPDGTPFDPPIMWGSQGTADGQFSNPYDVAVDGVGNVYVADNIRGSQTGNERVQKFDANGVFLDKWGTPGPGDGQFQGLSGIAAHTEGSATFVYAIDPDGVQKFDADGTHLHSWGSLGFGPGQFRDAWDVSTDIAGNVYTLESDGGGPGGNHRIQKFDPSGNFLAQFNIDSNGECWRRLAVDTAGFMYVVPECVGGGVRLLRYSPAGELVEERRCHDVGGWVGADGAGKVYVGTHNNSAILVFGEGGGPCPSPPAPPPPPDGGGSGGSPGLTFGGAEGVTIDDGARFTNDPNVVLKIVPPGGATQARISNDGGFRDPTGAAACASTTAGTCVTDLVPDQLYAWILDRDPGRDERLPKTVYVRFAGAGGASALTFTDDIILDTTAPTIPSATITEAPSDGDAASASAVKKRYTVRLRARDNASGVDKMQLAVRRTKPGKLTRYRARSTVRGSRPPVYVRVSDRAGNLSKWRRIKLRRRAR